MSRQELSPLDKQAMSMPHRPLLERTQHRALQIVFKLLEEGQEECPIMNLQEEIIALEAYHAHLDEKVFDPSILKAISVSTMYRLFDTAFNTLCDDYIFFGPVESRSLIHGDRVGDDVRQEVLARIHDRYTSGVSKYTPENTLTVGRAADSDTFLIREVYTRSIPLTVNGEQRCGEVNEHRTYSLTPDKISRLGISRNDLHYHDYVGLPDGTVGEQRIQVPLPQDSIDELFVNEQAESEEVTHDEMSILLHHVVQNIVCPRMRI